MMRRIRRIIDERRARQGNRGGPVLWVLLGGLFLAGLYLVVMMVWTFVETPAGVSQEAARDAVGGPGATTGTTSQVPPANPAYPVPSVPSADAPVTPPPSAPAR